MRVFNINKAVGYASSGVEYAQKYRREVFAGIDWVDDQYVFTDYLPTNISVFTDRLGFDRAQVRWIYHLVTGRETRPSTMTVTRVVAMIGQPHEAPRPGPGYLVVALSGTAVHYRIWTLDPPGADRSADPIVDRVELVVGDQLVRVEHYDETLDHVEHFHQGRLVRRVFHTRDGAVGAEQHYRDGEITRTVITPASPLYQRPVRRRGAIPSTFRGDVVLEGRSAFFQYVFARLFDRPDDVVIVDRALDVIDGIYPVIGEHRLYSTVHAEHFDLKQDEDGVLLWNNHYEHVFAHPDLIDGFIVSTRRQQEVLRRQLARRFPEGGFSVPCIPVGVVAQPAPAPTYDRFALVTASRLADEKHLDLLVRAVALARRQLPDLRLDIFGEGNRERLVAVIEETETQECVRLMGHRSLAGTLGEYGLYVSASTSEGFGLSLLEAIAEGLPIVGFDVDYGNREMVDHGRNGVLLPVPPGDLDDSVAAFADAIVELVTSDDLDEMRRHSLRKAEAFTMPRVRERWERLLCEETPC